ncbi:hypothetical protein [Polaromonas sp.]|uniref:hypothetical protein n=1 Tax=Polaromonas sp. TaxID=1869339 RepID=UPI002733856A|nr:hypothetical protein [Polaromonas sp.]
MKMFRRLTVLGALLASVGAPLLAQQQPKWVNQELLAKQLPTAQYEAIGRGALAQCRAEGQTTTERTLPATVDCSNVIQTLGDWNPAAYMECRSLQEQRKAQREQMFRDIALGCMAKQGWLLH